jgi:lipopolysaccharide export system protein LptA
MLRGALWILTVLVLIPAVGEAQERVCDFSSRGRTEQVERGGTPVILLHDPFEVQCSDGAVLRANSGTLNRLSRELELVGEVFFQDPDRTLTAQRATYTSTTGRLYATGNVVFTDRVEGSTIEGPELEYYRTMEGRPQPEVVANQRPHLTLQPRGERGDAEPLELDADRVTILGSDNLHALGRVVIHSGDVEATGAEARYDGAAEQLILRRQARIHNERFTLTGQIIEARLANGALEHVHAREDASLVGQDLTVNGPDLQLFFASDLLQRAVARGVRGDSVREPQRVVALSQSFRLEADSLDAAIPGQELEQVVAVGDARAEAVDTTATEPRVAVADSEVQEAEAPSALALVEHDWLEGDTITGFFAPVDTAARPRAEGEAAETDAETEVVLQRLVARGAAQSLYRVQDENAEDGRRGYNYLSGQVIELSFEHGELELAQVAGLRRGLYLDPVPAANPSSVEQNETDEPGEGVQTAGGAR